MCFYWGMRQNPTCTFILKVFMLFFDRRTRSKNSVCFDTLTLGHIFGRKGTEIYLSSFLVLASADPPLKASVRGCPINVVPAPKED